MATYSRPAYYGPDCPPTCPTWKNERSPTVLNITKRAMRVAQWNIYTIPAASTASPAFGRFRNECSCSSGGVPDLLRASCHAFMITVPTSLKQK